MIKFVVLLAIVTTTSGFMIITTIMSALLSMVVVYAGEEEMMMSLVDASGSTLMSMNKDYIEHEIVGSPARTKRRTNRGGYAKQQRRMKASSSSSYRSNIVSKKKKTKKANSSKKKKGSKSTKSTASEALLVVPEEEEDLIQDQEQHHQQQEELVYCVAECTQSNSNKTEVNDATKENQTDDKSVKEEENTSTSSSPPIATSSNKVSTARTAAPSSSPVTQTGKKGRGGVASSSPTLRPSHSGTLSPSSLISHPPSSHDANNLVEAISFGSIFISVSFPTRLSSRRTRIRRDSSSADRVLMNITLSTMSASTTSTHQTSNLTSNVDADNVLQVAVSVCLDTFAQKYGSAFQTCNVFLRRSIVDDKINQNELQKQNKNKDLESELYIMMGSVEFQKIQQSQDRQEQHHTSSLLPPTREQVTRHLAMVLLESETFLDALGHTSNSAIMMPSSSPIAMKTISSAVGNTTDTNSTGNIFTIILNSTVIVSIYYNLDGEKSSEEESLTFIDDNHDKYDDYSDDSTAVHNRTTLPPSKGAGSPGTAAGAGQQEGPQSRSRLTKKWQRHTIILITMIFIVLLLLVFIHVTFKHKVPLVFGVLCCGRVLGYCSRRQYCCCYSAGDDDDGTTTTTNRPSNCCCFCKKQASSYSTSSLPAAPSYSCTSLPPSRRPRIIHGGNITTVHCTNRYHHRHPTITSIPSSISFAYLDDDDHEDSSPIATTKTTSYNNNNNNNNKNQHLCSLSFCSNASNRNDDCSNDEEEEEDSSNNCSLHLWSKWNDTRYKGHSSYNNTNSTTPDATSSISHNTPCSTIMNATSVAVPTTNSTIISNNSSSSSSGNPLKNIKFRNVMESEQDDDDDDSGNDFERVWKGEIV